MTRTPYKFIPEIRERIAAQIPGHGEIVDAAIASWEEGNEPASPFETGVFSVCDATRESIRKFEV